MTDVATLTPLQQLQAIVTPQPSVCSLLSISEEQMAWLVFESGLGYLAGHYSTARAAGLAKSRPFWNWFRMCWASLDKEILADQRECIRFQGQMEQYKTERLQRMDSMVPPRFITAKAKPLC